MNVGVNDSITALYNSQQIAKQNNMSDNKISSAPENVSVKTSMPTKKEKIGVGICSALGVGASLMLLAKLSKGHNYTINPLKMFRGSIKDSYLAKTEYKTKQIVTIGAGSILGGLAGGAIFGKKEDSQARLREGIVQIANISAPIALVQALSWAGNTVSGKLMPNWCNSKNLLKQAVTKLPAAAGAMTGLISGMVIGNKLSNKFNEKVFHKKDDRPIKWEDFSAHVDDIGVAATFVAPDNILTKTISRVIPAALVVAGFETGTKKESVE